MVDGTAGEKNLNLGIKRGSRVLAPPLIKINQQSLSLQNRLRVEPNKRGTNLKNSSLDPKKSGKARKLRCVPSLWR